MAANAADTVKIHYTGKLSDGNIFDSSADREPLEFTLGQGTVLAGLESAIIGMEKGDTKTVTLASADSTITLDANHPLADEDLVFEIELVDIQASA